MELFLLSACHSMIQRNTIPAAYIKVANLIRSCNLRPRVSIPRLWQNLALTSVVMTTWRTLGTLSYKNCRLKVTRKEEEYLDLRGGNKRKN
jgi:hypothetical protein